MAGIKNILIIVNANGRNPLQLLAICPVREPNPGGKVAQKWQNSGD